MLSSLRKRIADMRVGHAIPEKRLRHETPFLRQKSALLQQPAEIFNMIANKLTIEEAFQLARTSKHAKNMIDAFQARLRYDWFDSLFKRLSAMEKAVNMEYLLLFITQTAQKKGQCVENKLFEWLKNVPEKCPSLSTPLFFETLLKCWGEKKATKLIGRLIKEWMFADAQYYLQAFPIGPESSSNAIETERQLFQRFHWVVNDKLNPRSKVVLFSLLLRSLATISETYKLIYLFSAPRKDGFVDFDYFSVTHQPEEGELNFGKLDKAFKLIMYARRMHVECAFSEREIFIILEDMTTTPVIWSMHNFVKFLMTSATLSVLSTLIRFTEGYQEDSASTFYYTIRADAQPDFLANVVSGIARSLGNEAALGFFEKVFDKSLEVFRATDPSNNARVKMLREAHKRLLDAFQTGFEKCQLKVSLRLQPL